MEKLILKLDQVNLTQTTSTVETKEFRARTSLEKYILFSINFVTNFHEVSNNIYLALTCIHLYHNYEL